MGGKIIVVSATLPNIGDGQLKARDDIKALGTSGESTLLQPASGFYKSFAVSCSKAQVSVDMFLFGTHYLDVASLSRQLWKFTIGIAPFMNQLTVHPFSSMYTAFHGRVSLFLPGIQRRALRGRGKVC